MMADAGPTPLSFADAADVAQLLRIINSTYDNDAPGDDSIGNDDNDDVFVQTTRAPAGSTHNRLLAVSLV